MRKFDNDNTFITFKVQYVSRIKIHVFRSSEEIGESDAVTESKIENEELRKRISISMTLHMEFEFKIDQDDEPSGIFLFTFRTCSMGNKK